MSRPSLADRLARVAGPQINSASTSHAEAAPASPQAASRPVNRRPNVQVEPPQALSVSPKARDGKTMIAGYFTPAMARSVKILAVERDLTVQALIGEGLDMVLHKYGKHPMGER